MLDAIKSQEKEKILKKNEKELLKEWEKKQVEFLKTKEKISLQVELDNELLKLKDLVSSWKIDKNTIEKITKWELIEDSVLEEIFDKIDEIEDIKEIDKYLPKDLRITKEEYKTAMTDDIQRIQTLTKLNTSLTLLANQIIPVWTGTINLFSGFLLVLDKNLKKIQENTIDIRDNLQEIEDKKNPKVRLGFWASFIEFIKSIFA